MTEQFVFDKVIIVFVSISELGVLLFSLTIRASLAPSYTLFITLFLLEVKRRLDCSRPFARARRKRSIGHFSSSFIKT